MTFGHRLCDWLHRVWRKRLTDFWHLDYHCGRGDHACDDLFITGEATLAW